MAPIFPTPFIDMAAANGGFGSLCRPLVTGGDPPSIVAFTTQLTDKLRSLTSTLTELERSRDQLRQLWPSGTGSDAAMRKLTASFAQFDRTIQAANQFIQQLQSAASKLNTAQQGCNAAIQTTEPTVGALLTNPFTHPAATALATGSTASIAGFLKGIGGVLSAIGQNNLGGVMSGLSSIATGVAQLASPSSAATPPATSVPAAGTGTVATAGTTAQTSLADLGSLTTATPAATTPTPAATTVPPTTTTAPPAVPTTLTTAAPSGHHVTVTVNGDGSVVVDSDVSAQVDVVERNADGSEVDKHVSVSAGGTASA